MPTNNPSPMTKLNRFTVVTFTLCDRNYGCEEILQHDPKFSSQLVHCSKATVFHASPEGKCLQENWEICWMKLWPLVVTFSTLKPVKAWCPIESCFQNKWEKTTMSAFEIG
jgi:hypothetical protein